MSLRILREDSSLLSLGILVGLFIEELLGSHVDNILFAKVLVCVFRHIILMNRETREFNKKVGLIGIFVIVFASQFSPVKADLVDTVSSFMLLIIFMIFVFAGIGWWTKRQEAKL